MNDVIQAYFDWDVVAHSLNGSGLPPASIVGRVKHAVVGFLRNLIACAICEGLAVWKEDVVALGLRFFYGLVYWKVVFWPRFHLSILHIVKLG